MEKQVFRKMNNKERKKLNKILRSFSTHPRQLFIGLGNQNINTHNS
jgi:hypothetical protein